MNHLRSVVEFFAMLVLNFTFGGMCAFFGFGAAQGMTGRRRGLADRIKDGTRFLLLR